MKISKMMIHYVGMFTATTAAAYYYWDPKTDDEIRRDVEAKVRPDAERRLKNQAKYRELLLQRSVEPTEETKKQLEEITNFTTPRRK